MDDDVAAHQSSLSYILLCRSLLANVLDMDDDVAGIRFHQNHNCAMQKNLAAAGKSTRNAVIVIIHRMSRVSLFPKS